MSLDEAAQASILEFASFIGTKASFASDGSSAFRFAQSGLFSIQASPDGHDLLLTLSRPQNVGNFDFVAALKSGAADTEVAGSMVLVGLNQALDVVVSTRLKMSAVSLQTLLGSLEALKKRQREIGF
jgi:hypothetical protein